MKKAKSFLLNPQSFKRLSEHFIKCSSNPLATTLFKSTTQRTLFKISLFLFLGTILSETLTGCSYALQEAGLYPASKNTASPKGKSNAEKFSDQKITFEVVKVTALVTCLECHTSGRNAMATKEQFLAQKDLIRLEIENNEMPPKSSGFKLLSECEKQILETWIEDQDKNLESVKISELSKCTNTNSPEKIEKPDINTLSVSFENLQKYILAPKCLSCHSSETREGDIVLESIQSLQDGQVIASTAEESLLYRIVLPGKKGQMPPAKSGLPRLTDDELNFLKKWIDNGAKD
jgi:uncharacterized membrane protein